MRARTQAPREERLVFTASDWGSWPLPARLRAETGIRGASPCLRRRAKALPARKTPGPSPRTLTPCPPPRAGKRDRMSSKDTQTKITAASGGAQKGTGVPSGLLYPGAAPNPSSRLRRSSYAILGAPRGGMRAPGSRETRAPRFSHPRRRGSLRSQPLRGPSPAQRLTKALCLAESRDSGS